jgi:hypothetical protein
MADLFSLSLLGRHGNENLQVLFSGLERDAAALANERSDAGACALHLAAQRGKASTLNPILFKF